jgi:hypothetical protein
VLFSPPKAKVARSNRAGSAKFPLYINGLSDRSGTILNGQSCPGSTTEAVGRTPSRDRLHGTVGVAPTTERTFQLRGLATPDSCDWLNVKFHGSLHVFRRSICSADRISLQPLNPRKTAPRPEDQGSG